jgi:hypothetical protein
MLVLSTLLQFDKKKEKKTQPTPVYGCHYNLVSSVLIARSLKPLTAASPKQDGATTKVSNSGHAKTEEEEEEEEDGHLVKANRAY